MEQLVAREVHSLKVGGSSPPPATSREAHPQTGEPCNVKFRNKNKRMSKEVVISTSGLNCYGSRVLTSGIDLSQYKRNPILLWMHRRCFNGKDMPIGRIENLRIDGDLLIGTPVFDKNDEFAKQIASKWENGFLRMASAGIEIVETSTAPEHILPGQSRATITRCKLEEVSIVDIGGNDEALQLYGTDGKLMTLSKGEESEHLPLLNQERETAGAEAPASNKQNNKTKKRMNKEILQLLGLPETASEQEAVNALRLLKEKADKTEKLELGSIKSLVDGAIADKRITADKKDHFVGLGKSAGIEMLRETLSMMKRMHKPTEVIHETTEGVGGEHKTYAKLSEVPASEIPTLKESNPTEYARLYKAEYDVEV